MIESILLITLLVFFALLLSWSKNRFITILLALIFSLLMMLEISAVYLTGRWVDHRFLQHLNIHSLQSFQFQFNGELLMFAFSWIVLAVVLYFMGSLVSKLKIKTGLKALVITISFVLMLIPNGIIQPLWQSFKLTHANSQSFYQALSDLGIEPQAYINPADVTAKTGSNIIVISLESLEQGFLHPPYDNLTPNLNRLKNEWTFFSNMPSSPGSDWTAASLYTHQTGLPALFNQQHFDNNHLFQGSQSFKLTSLNDVLKAAGYVTKYIIGKPDFAGMSNILNALGIEVISEQNSIGRYPNSPVGLHDYDLFAEAKLQIDRLSENSNQPFALFLSTINSHFPDGIMDERMTEFVGPKDNQLEFLIAATDYLISDFLNYLDAKGLMESTTVFIFPDHPLMGNSGEVIKTLKRNNRQLYLLSSADENQFPWQPVDTIYQADLPRMILAGARIQNNAKFLTDWVSRKDFNHFINENGVAIAALNNAALTRQDFSEGINISLVNNELFIQSNDNILSSTVRLFKPTEVFQVTFNKDMIPLLSEQIDFAETFTNDHVDPELKQLFLQIFINNGTISRSTLSNRLGDEVIQNQAPFNFTEAEIKNLVRINQTKPIPEDLTKQHIPLQTYSQNPDRFIAHAGGKINNHTYTNSLDALKHNYENGFRLFELDILSTADEKFVAAHDWPQWQKQTGYSGELPPTHEQFMRHRILGQYLPLDMSSINQWFAAHPDAILVTDKVNKPAEFADLFIDKQRLMMELFSWPAVNKALSLNIRAVLPTGDLLLKIPGNKITFLQDLGIKQLALSRRWMDGDRILLKKLVNAGFEIFAFHVGFDDGKNETHVVCHERNYFYGLYADDWNFSQIPEC